jgi:PAS domain S-box-containing protein
MRHLVTLDLVIALSTGLACLAIGGSLVHFVRRPAGRPYARMCLAFALFVAADGVLHLAQVVTPWHPAGGVALTLKLIAAVGAVTTALLLPPLVPTALVAAELARQAGDRRSAEAQVRALLESAPDAIIIVGPRGAIEMVNERAERMFGYARSDLLGRPATLLLPDDVRSARQEPRDGWGRRRDGSRFLAEVSLSPLSTAEGTLVTAVVRDVTERRRLEEERAERVRAESARAQAEDTGRRASFLAEASRVLSASLDYEATLRSVARVAIPYLADWVLVDVLESDVQLRRLAAAHADPLVERRLASAVPFVLAGAGGGPLGRVVERGEPTLVRDVSDEWLAARRPDAEHLGAGVGARPISLMLVPLRARGRTLGVATFALADGTRRYTLADLVLAEDLAQRAALAADNARLYRDAQDASRAKDEFLAILSHELRTPLTPVLGWVRMLRSGSLAPAAAERALDTVERNTRLQAQLVEDLLDVSRIITGKLSLALQSVALGPIVDAALESIAQAAVAKSIAITRQLDQDLPMVEADANRLQQVVANLLSNAVKFTPEGGRVTVTVERAAEHVRLCVSDTGAGLAPEIAPHIFDRFRQGDSTLTRQHGGLGLGLSIVRHVVEAHGGTVQASSPGPGRGSAFTVLIPIRGPAVLGTDEPQALPLRRESPADHPLQGVRVLVVDDDLDTREMVEVILQSAGARVDSAGAVEEALLRLREPVPDVVVSDLAMPGGDGYALMRELRARGLVDRLVTIALTAHARAEDRERALGAGYEAHVAKPVEPAALAALVRELVEKRRRRS